MTPHDRNMQIEFIYNVYKSVHGVKPHHVDFTKMTDSELIEMGDDLRKEDNEINNR